MSGSTHLRRHLCGWSLGQQVPAGGRGALRRPPKEGGGGLRSRDGAREEGQTSWGRTGDAVSSTGWTQLGGAEGGPREPLGDRGPKAGCEPDAACKGG